MEYIELGERKNVLRLGIKTKDGKDTGQVLEFDLKEIDLIDKLERMREENKKNHQWFNNQIVIINKKQDFKKKGDFMSNNEKLKYEAVKTFYQKQKEIYDIFLGEGGVDKLLYNRPLTWTSLREIDKLIEKHIVPKLDLTMDNIVEEIKQTYRPKTEESVLE